MTRNHRVDVVEQAITVLDTWGLADLTMRRLGAELGVRPSALYHHFASKQLLLAEVADELLRRGPRRPRPDEWSEAVRVCCADLRDAMLAYRDGAELVAAVRALGLGARAPHDELVALLTAAGLDAATVDVAARTLLHLVLGHTVDEQTHLQAGSVGVIDGPDPTDPGAGARFAAGVDLVVDGVRAPRGGPPYARLMQRVSTPTTSSRTSRLAGGAQPTWGSLVAGGPGPRWYVDALPWVVRGGLDRLAGGAGRAHEAPSRALETGDRAGFWYVEESDHDARRLVLRAEVRAPGEVRLTTTVEPDGTGCRLCQTVELRPAGVLGWAYLVVDLPARETVMELAHRRTLHDLGDLGQPA